MPIDISAGYSESTAQKQRDFGLIAGIHVNVAKGVLRRESWPYPRYVYIDLNAGPGVVNGMQGSPLIFLDRACAAGLPFEAWFLDREEAALTALIERYRGGFQHRMPSTDSVVLTHRGDHAETIVPIAEFYRRISQPVYGLCYADPNGEALPLEVMQRVAQVPAFKRLDFLAYVSATNYKRRGAVSDDCPLLSKHLKAVGKRYIHIRTPVAAHQWTFAFLTNWPGWPALTKQGFHRIDSDEGQEILRRLDLTREQYEATKKVPLPFDDARPTPPIGATPSISATRSSSRSGGRSSPGLAAGVSGAAVALQQSLIT